MADYSATATSINDALATSAGAGMIEEYEAGRGRVRVKRGKPTEQVQAALLLEGIAARRANGSGLFRVGKFQRPGS